MWSYRKNDVVKTVIAITVIVVAVVASNDARAKALPADTACGSDIRPGLHVALTIALRR